MDTFEDVAGEPFVFVWDSPKALEAFAAQCVRAAEHDGRECNAQFSRGDVIDEQEHAAWAADVLRLNRGRPINAPPLIPAAQAERELTPSHPAAVLPRQRGESRARRTVPGRRASAAAASRDGPRRPDDDDDPHLAFCAACGRSFAPSRKDGRYCSSACRQCAYRRRVRGSDEPTILVTDEIREWWLDHYTLAEIREMAAWVPDELAAMRAAVDDLVGAAA